MHGQKKRIRGNICLFFADEKISEVVLKICSFVNTLPYVYYLYKKRYKYCN